MKRVFLDTETTGLAPGQIGQLAMIVELDDGSLRAFNYFFDIDYLEDGAAKACGRDLDFYKKASNGKKFADYKTELLNILTDSTLIAHNEEFDEKFLSASFWREDIIFKPADRFCTMNFFRDIVKLTPGKYGHKYKNPKLSELIEYFNIDENKVQQYSVQLFGNDDNTNIGFHDARYDTTAMFVAFCIYRESTNNQDNWRRAFTK